MISFLSTSKETMEKGKSSIESLKKDGFDSFEM